MPLIHRVNRNRASESSSDWKDILKKPDNVILESHEEEAVINGLGRESKGQEKCTFRVLLALNAVIFVMYLYMNAPILVATSVGAKYDSPLNQLDPERPIYETPQQLLSMLLSVVLTTLYLLLTRRKVLHGGAP